ncbi:MAG: hypothetical protein P8M49_12905 [Thalassotalea sp.]|nr:hypothetical protein [Thalassotalea sp.]MDG2394410.1 hypothetical protein [Thalassotalea sp.]
MKSLFNTCAVLFTIPFFGKQLIPELFGVWYIQYPSYAILAILLPFGFAKSVLNNKQEEGISFPILFLLMSLMQLVSPITVNSGIKVVQSVLVPSDNKTTPLLLQLLDNPEASKRNFGAKYIYREYGESIYYRDGKDEFIKYTPDKEDVEFYKERNQTNLKLKDVNATLSNRASESMYLSIGFALSFFFVFCFVLAKEYRVKKLS